VQADATPVDPLRDTQLGTQAASPRAMGHASDPASSPATGHAAEVAQGSRSEQEARASWWGTASARPVTTAAEALDRSDLSRMRAFHTFGVIAPIGAIVMSTFLGGDPTARTAFWIGTSLLGACNVVLLYLTTSERLYRPIPVGFLWLLSNVGFLPAIVYFGPFSAVVMVNMLALVFISLGRLRWPAVATAAIGIGGHLAIAVPIIVGWIRDRGVLTSFHAEAHRLWIAEVLVIGFLASGYGLGRWARSMNARALAELQQAMRVIGDKEQALAEVVDHARRASRANEGRWTHQTMGSFQLGLVLGRGAMGEVYEATRSDGTPAAVKLLNAGSTASTTLVERFHASWQSRRGSSRRTSCGSTSYRGRRRRCRTWRWSGCTAPIWRAGCGPRAGCPPTSWWRCSIRSRAGSRSRGSPASCTAISSRTTCSSMPAPPGRSSTSASRRCWAPRAR
jgi:hypothetical protein